MPTFDTREPISVTIDLSVGDALFIASDRTDTVVVVRPSNGSKSSDVDAAEQTQIDYADGRLLVRTPKRWTRYTPFSRVGSIDVTIELPTGSRLHGASELGKFHSEGELEECTLKTAMGDIRLDRTGKLQANTAYGDLTVNRVVGEADVTTGSGEVRIGQIAGTAHVKNSNGDTRIGDAEGDLRIKAANGDISVARARASVNAKTANGNVRLGDVIEGTIVLETAAGELEVGIHEGTSAWLDVSSQCGNVHNSLADSAAPQGSDKTVRVRARTSCGDIVIRRATTERTAPAK